MAIKFFSQEHFVQIVSVVETEIFIPVDYGSW